MHLFSIYYLQRCKLNRWVSTILLLSILRLQIVFCGCGGVGYFEMPNHHSVPSSCCDVESENSHCDSHDCDAHERLERIYSVCDCCVDCDHNSPIHRHSHQLQQPKVTSNSRLHVDAFVPVRAWPASQPFSLARLQSVKACDQRCFAAQTNLLNLLGQLRI